MIVLSIKILCGFVAVALLAVVIGYFVLQRRIEFCRQSSDTLVAEFAVTKTTDNLFSKAQELGFTQFYLKDDDAGKEYNFEKGMSLNQTSLLDLQKILDATEHAHVDAVIVPFPPFLRWIVGFQIESKKVKSVGRTQLD